ncbi:MAG: hypothetical protein D6818_05030, partial [Bacteroidetes bacterium]
MGSNRFDDILRHKLRRLDPPYDPATWQRLQARLEAEGLTRDPADADELIADKLRRLEQQPGLAQPDWDAFAEMLDAAETSDADAFDEAVRGKLSGMHPDDRPDWPRMDRMIDERLTLGGHLRRYRVPEVVVALLFLFTFFPYVQLWTPGTDWWRLPVSWFDDETAGPANAGMPPPARTAAQKPLATIPEHLPVTVPGLSANATHEALPARPAPSAADRIGAPARPVVGVTPPARRIEEKVRLATAAPSSPLDRDDLLASLETAMSNLQAEGTLEAALPLVGAATRKHVRLALVTATDVNFVVSPYDPVFGTPSDTTLAVGYGGGLMVAVQRNRWEWETGLLYTFKRYTPNTPRQLLGSLEYLVEENFDGIQLDILQVPLHVRHNIWWHPNWSFWMHAGASAHLVLNPYYDIRHREVTPLLATIPSSEKDPGEVLEQSRLREKEFPIGLLQGGSLHDNSWLTLNLGLGVERHFTDRLSLMAQPAIQYDLTTRGFGPNADRLHALSLWMGLRWRV